MRYILFIIPILLTSCMFSKKQWNQVSSVNRAPTVMVPFDQVDTNNDGNITKDEYLADASTLDVDTPGYTMLSILIGTGVLVGILIFLTTCYKGPTGLGRSRD